MAANAKRASNFGKAKNLGVLDSSTPSQFKQVRYDSTRS